MIRSFHIQHAIIQSTEVDMISVRIRVKPTCTHLVGGRRRKLFGAKHRRAHNEGLPLLDQASQAQDTRYDLKPRHGYNQCTGKVNAVTGLCGTCSVSCVSRCAVQSTCSTAAGLPQVSWGSVYAGGVRSMFRRRFVYSVRAIDIKICSGLHLPPRCTRTRPTRAQAAETSPSLGERERLQPKTPSHPIQCAW